MNINFTNNSSKRNSTKGTFIDYPIKHQVIDANNYNNNIVTWADFIDWGEYNLQMNSNAPTATVANTYSSFIDALKANFDYLYELASTGQTPATVSVTGVSINPTSFTLSSAGATKQLTETVTPSNATNKNVSWTSSNTSVATVSSTGLVTAVSNGTATITCKTADGNKTATSTCTCSWTVNVPVTGVSISPTTSLSLAVNGTKQLTANVAPSTATNKAVTWTSSNTSVATVSASGLVTAKAVGAATITVTTTDGNKTATCSVTVSQVTQYWYSVGQTQITSSNYTTANNAVQVSSYQEINPYVNPSRSYIYILVSSSKSVQLIDPSINGVIDIIEDTSVNISGYKVWRSGVKVNGTVNIKIY